MKLRPIASNMTELTTTEGTVILFSYQTPVAALLPSGRYVKTSRKWSVTTSRHVNKWLCGIEAEPEPQEFFDRLSGE